MIDVELDFVRMRDYLSGRMSDEDREAFEDRLIRDPELVRELELSLKLGAGLDDLRRSDKRGRSPLRSSRNWIIPLGIAASLSGIALVIWILRPGTDYAQLLVASPAIVATNGAPPPIVAQFSFIETRSLAIPDLDLPATGLVELRVRPSHQSPALRYTITLKERQLNSSTLTGGVLAGLTADRDGYVRTYVEASRLRPGQYELRVEANAAADHAVDTFAFNFRSADRPSSPKPD
jgi:hypothetical protein